VVKAKFPDLVMNCIPRTLAPKITLVTSALVQRYKINLDVSQMVFHLTISESPVWFSNDVPRFTNTNSVPKSEVDCFGQTQRSLPREQI